MEGENRPRRICLCGSTRFKKAFNEWNVRLTLEGNVVLSVAMTAHADRLNPTPKQKELLDRLHFAKIDLADEIFVLDVGKYAGYSTNREIAYAVKTGKPVRLLSQEFPDWTEADCIWWRDPGALRRRLPDERQAITRKFEIAGHDFYLSVGLYPEDGTPGEAFIRSAKEGSTLAGLLDTIGILFSLALQYGVPLQAITDKLSFSAFEPAGYTGVPGIEFARSPIDFVARWMAQKFLPPAAAPEDHKPLVTVPPSPVAEAPVGEPKGDA